MDTRSPDATPILPGLDLPADPAGLDYEAKAPPPDAERFTAAAFLRKNPDKCKKVVQLLGAGYGQRRIASLVGCSPQTVREVMAALPEDVVTAREQHQRRIRIGSATAFEALLEKLEDPAELKKMNVLQLATAWGIIEDKTRKEGPASVTVNINAPGHGDLQTYLDKLQRVGPEEPRAMGLPAKSFPAKEMRPGPALEVDPVEGCATHTNSKSESVDSESPNMCGNAEQKGNL